MASQLFVTFYSKKKLGEVKKDYENLYISKKSDKAQTAVFEFLIKELEKKNKVKIALFGSFNLKTKSARIGRNPKTKEIANIISRNVVRFKPSKMLIKKINKQINE